MNVTTRRAGFSLVEVIIAMIILGVGVLAMGASTGYIMAQIRAAELRTERMTAVRQAAETLRATPWNQLNTACQQPLDVGAFTVSCTVSNPSANRARVELVTVGPGYRAGGFHLGTADTFAISLAKPVQ